MEAEPSPRWSHVCAAVEEKLCVWGGRTKEFLKEKELVPSIYSFDPLLEFWEEKKCCGDMFPGLYNGASASAGHHLYVYGGYDGYHCHSSLHQLDTTTCTWKSLPAGHTKKTNSGMVYYNNKLVVFGGYGFPSGPTQPGAEFIQNTKSSDGSGWTNEVHTFDLNEGCPWQSCLSHPSYNLHTIESCLKTNGEKCLQKMSTGYNWNVASGYKPKTGRVWSSPAVSGTRPPPCSEFSLTMINTHKAVLFGGKRPPGPVVTKDVYILDLARMHWSKLDHHEGDPCPVGRLGHAAVCLGYGGDHPQLFVTGGKGGNKVLSDAWMLDVQSGRWRKIKFPSLQSRCWHSAAALSLSPGLVEVIIFGGCPEWPSNYRTNADLRQIANTTVLRFESQQRPSTGGALTTEWVLTDTADSTKLGTRERVRAKVRKIQATRTTAAATGDGGKEESDRRVREAEERAREAEGRIREAQQRLLESEEKLQRLETQWVVERREIQMTDQELGRGGWATVSVATFRGARVAAKCIHGEIISNYNIRLFKREMNVAARIRHPNLLQFIGATLEGEMVILTELMPTSLRRELEKQPISPNQATGIGLDVARALNYLHLMRPHPLVHRDISSANVLLEPLPNSRWRAKVSDYGTVNLLQKLTTICPGNACYSAPEAYNPTQQTPKMDIFSFGVLLMEMLAGEFPDPDERPHLLGKIRHQQLLALIQRCLSEGRQERPNASDIISELNRLAQSSGLTATH